MGSRKPPTPRTRPLKTPTRPTPSSRNPRKPSRNPAPTSETPGPKTPRIKRRVSDFATKKPSAKKRKRDTPHPNQDIDELLRDVPQLIKAEDSPQAIQLRHALKRAKKSFQNDESGSDSTLDDVEEITPRQTGESNGNSNRETKRQDQHAEVGGKRKRGPTRTPDKEGLNMERKSPRASESFVTPAKPPLPQSRKLDLSAKRARLRDPSAKKAKRMSVTASAHKRDIEALKQDDPEFYKFLEQHDASLLDFDLEDDLLGLSAEEDENGKDDGGDETEDDNDYVADEESRENKKFGTKEGESNDMNRTEEGESDERDETAEKKDCNSGSEEYRNGDIEEKVVEPIDRKQMGKTNTAGTSVAMNSRKKLDEPQNAKTEVEINSGSERNDSEVVEQEATPLRPEPVKAKTAEEDVMPEKASHTSDSDSDDEEEEEPIMEDEAATEAAPAMTGQASGVERDLEETANDDGCDLPLAVSDPSRAEATKPNSDDGDSSHSDEYSDDDDERHEEMLAAAEAGLVLDNAMDVSSGDELSSDEESPSAQKKKKTVIVDTESLRSLKEALSRKRTCLKATKELLRLLRAGREILPSQADIQDKKAKMTKKKSQGRYSANKQSEDPEEIEDEFADDGSFTSGNVKFVSSKAYQNGMNLAIVGIQDALDLMLGRPQSKKGPPQEAELLKWDPTSNVRWPNLQPVFRPYVFHMLTLSNTMNDPDTLRFLLKRLERLVPYTRDNELLRKKIIRTAVRVWSSDSQHMSEATRLRAYILLNKIAHGHGNSEAVLRSCCTVFAGDIATACNLKTLPRIRFAITCIVELFGIDMGASYTTAFANLRELAVSLRAVLVSKEATETERIHNWSYVNQLRLWSKVLSRYGSEDELRPLIYPYVQVALGVMRVQATPRTFPMRLHIASFLSDLVANTGTFIPLTPHLLLLLRCTELRKKPERGKTKALEWRTMLQVSADVIKTKPFLSGIVNGVVFELAKFFATVSKHVSFPELAYVAQSTLRKFSKEVQVPEWKSKVSVLVEKLHKTSELIEKARAKADFAPHGAVNPEGMLGVVPGLDRDMKTPIQRFFEVESKRVRKEGELRDEQANDEKKEQGKGDTRKDAAKVHFAGHDAQFVSKETSTDASDSAESDSDGDSEEGDPEGSTGKRSKIQLGRKEKPEKAAARPALSVPKTADDDDEDDMVEDLVIDSDISSEDE